MPDEITLGGLGGRLARYLREADLPAPLKQYLAIKGTQASALGELLGGDPRQAAEQAYLGGDYNPRDVLMSAIGTVGAPAVGPAGVATLGAGLVRPAAATTQALRTELKPFGLYKKDVTVDAPLRLASPGIYQNPRAIVQQAAERLGPESPNLQALFGVSRQDLYDIASSRKGNIRPEDIPGLTLRERAIPEAVQQIMTPANEQRVIDAMALSNAVPGLRNMRGWYVMDPAFERLQQLVGPEEAVKQWMRLNTTHGVMSAMSGVDPELMRGSVAAMLAQEGRFPEFVRYGGSPRKSGEALSTLSAGVPEEFRFMPGHMAHSTAQIPALQRYLDTGELSFTTGKVPAYVSSSGVPQTGFQTGYPVIDTHMGRQLGYFDVRRAEKGSMSLRETDPIARWYSERIAGPLGIEPGYAQPQGWTLYGPQTDVRSVLGAPKLEIVSDLIARRAAREGMDPEAVRDAWLMSKGAIGAGAGLVTLPTLGELARPPE